MATIELTWIEKQRYIGVDSSNHSTVISPPDDIGMKPSDLLLVSLASCTAYDTVEIIEKRRAILERLRVTVEGEQADEAPWAYEHIHLTFDIEATDISQAQLERAVDLSLNKYCSVRASLSPDIAVTFEVNLV